MCRYIFRWNKERNNNDGILEYVKSNDNSDNNVRTSTKKPDLTTILKTQKLKEEKKKTKRVDFDANEKDATQIKVDKARLLPNLAQMDDS